MPTSVHTYMLKDTHTHKNFKHAQKKSTINKKSPNLGPNIGCHLNWCHPEEKAALPVQN